MTIQRLNPYGSSVDLSAFMLQHLIASHTYIPSDNLC